MLEFLRVRPLLFLIYINNLPENPKLKLQMKPLCFHSFRILTTLLNIWTFQWKMSFNLNHSKQAQVFDLDNRFNKHFRAAIMNLALEGFL